MSDTDWASCVRTRRSFIGSLIKLAGAAVAYKTQLQDTVATSSTESKFMAAYEVGKMLLYVRSILWDLDVPQEAAYWLYKDNDACTPMACPEAYQRTVQIPWEVCYKSTLPRGR